MIALVKNAKEDGGLGAFNMGEMFRASGRPECLSSVTDDDIKVLTHVLIFCLVFLFTLRTTLLLPSTYQGGITIIYLRYRDDIKRIFFRIRSGCAVFTVFYFNRT